MTATELHEAVAIVLSTHVGRDDVGASRDDQLAAAILARIVPLVVAECAKVADSWSQSADCDDGSALVLGNAIGSVIRRLAVRDAPAVAAEENVTVDDVMHEVSEYAAAAHGQPAQVATRLWLDAEQKIRALVIRLHASSPTAPSSGHSEV